ncbi:uncharacterized protein LOC123560161 [Mercenaria mercenaria]|uniref:uncharacterized protein LOC123560161 n=1 Tax=Mercenaria mercenaria TaxID=6596 RepID=UPI00234FAB31|nr:uncharacterized protein LOC123560161 [Mercenaria mercenaria]
MSFAEGSMNFSDEDENETSLSGIFDLLESPDCESPEVILLIGRSGAGKSALINTLHKVLTGKYYPIAKHGSGKALTVTMELNRYEHCGAQLHRISNASRKERMNDTIRKLPHIIDCAGLADENSWKLRELLELLIGGYIRPGTSISGLEIMQTEYGEGGLTTAFDVSNPEWKVTKIVFVQGCIDAIPINLIACLRQTLEIVDKDTFTRKYRVGIFVLITKYDLVKDSKDINLYGKDQDKSISLTDLEKVETALAQELNFEGALESNRIRWVSLTDNTGLDNPYVENIALRFLKKMIEPGVPDVQYTEPILNMRKKIKLKMKRWGNELKELFLLLLFAAFMVALLAFCYYLLNETAVQSVVNNIMEFQKK